MKELLEIYKAEIEIFLGTMGVFKGNKVININPTDNEENKKFIREKILQLHSGNVDEKVLNEAIDELLPYLYEK